MQRNLGVALLVLLLAQQVFCYVKVEDMSGSNFFSFFDASVQNAFDCDYVDHYPNLRNSACDGPAFSETTDYACIQWAAGDQAAGQPINCNPGNPSHFTNVYTTNPSNGNPQLKFDASTNPPTALDLNFLSASTPLDPCLLSKQRWQEYTAGLNWPQNGEIDIMENLWSNGAYSSKSTFHTPPSCVNSESTDPNCSNDGYGCGKVLPNSPFDQAILITEWTISYIRIWALPISTTVADPPDLSSLGTPSYEVVFSSDCESSEFSPLKNLIIDTKANDLAVSTSDSAYSTWEFEYIRTYNDKILTYVGCVDGTGNPPLNWGGIDSYMTSGKCYEICNNWGYGFYGNYFIFVNGPECWCAYGDNINAVSFYTGGNKCDLRSPGASGEEAGSSDGDYKTSMYSANNYIGCFEHTTGFLPYNYNSRMSGTINADSCNHECLTNKWAYPHKYFLPIVFDRRRYSGFTADSQCYCGNNLPTASATMLSSGQCVNAGTISAEATGLYMGCHVMDPNWRTLITNSASMTPLYCSNQCQDINYAYSATQGSSCYCTNDYSAAQSMAPNSACTILCPGDPDQLQICGGSGTWSVYHSYWEF